MFKDVPEMNADKAIIKEFYEACIKYLNETCPDTANLNTIATFEFKLSNSEMNIRFDSFEKFNNEILSDTVFENILVILGKHNIKTSEKYIISFRHTLYDNKLNISSSNKLWTDETALEFQKFFSDISDKNKLTETSMNLPKSTVSNDLPKRDKSVITNDLPNKTITSLFTNKFVLGGIFAILIIILVWVLYPNNNISKIKTPFLEAEFSNNNPVIKEESKHLFQSNQLEDIESIVAENKKSNNTTLQTMPKQPVQDPIVKKPIFGEDNITKFTSSQRIRTTEVLFSYPGRVDATITYEDDLVLESFCGFVEFILKDNLGNIIATYKSRYDCIEGSVGTKKVRYTQLVDRDIANKVSSIEAKAYTK